MASLASSALATVQARRFSARSQANMRKRGGAHGAPVGVGGGGRASLYKQMYGNDAKNGEINVNEQFVHACENGDYNAVNRILEETPKFNIDVTDQLGRTAMRLAIENEHLEVVTLLLAHCDGQKMREALLLAIYLGHVQIAEACLRHPKFKVLNDKRVFTGNDDSFWQTPSSDDAQFAPDITPLILASQYNRTEIVQLLLRGGDRITKPHDYHCKCQECQNKFKFDSLRHAQSRLNAYRGLASESYISLASIDPILTAFELGHELRDLSGKEKYFKNEYLNLADHLSLYAVKLLDKVRGHKELDCVLGKTGKETEEKYVLLARLYLAIKYEEKPFVAHSNCQQKLVEIWHSDIRNIFKLNPLIILLLTLSYVFFLPFACLFYILTSWSKRTIKFQTFLKQPCIKFLGHTVSYAIFILFIILSSLLNATQFQKVTQLNESFPWISAALNNSIDLCQTSYQNSCFFYPQNDNFYYRHMRPTWIDITISVFIVGFLWHEIKQGYTDGLKDYLLSWNNIVDSCMNILYLSSFALKYYVFFKVSFAYQSLTDSQFVNDTGQLYNLNQSRQSNIYQTFYWLNADRFYWVSFDPVNVAEGLFAIANIFSFSRICFLLPAIQHLGPLQISLGRMMSDIGKFIIIFLIIFCGFMFGLNNLFWYYSASVRGKVEVVSHVLGSDDPPLPAETYFGTMGNTFKTVFWSLFGLSEKDGVKLGNYNNNFTELIGYLIYGTFNIASVIVLLNMLIAMMSKSYETIEEHADVEWKFARSKLYMEYIKQGGTLPVPFNIIPTPKSLYYLYQRIFQCKKKSSSNLLDPDNILGNDNPLPVMIQRPPPNIATPNSNKNGPLSTISNGQTSNTTSNYNARRKSFDTNQTLTYRKVMERVIKRFLLHKQREEQDEIREGDFEELKQDIQMLRFEMMNRLDETRDDLSKNSLLLNEGVLVVGELLSSLTRETNPIMKENFHLFKNNFYSTLDKIRSIDSGMESTEIITTPSNTTSSNTTSSSILSTTSMPNIGNQMNLIKALPTSNSDPTLSINDDRNESDINPIQVIRHLSAAHITLSNIAEENEEDENINKHNEEKEDEIEARHMSIQTSTDDEKSKDEIFVLKI